MSQRAYLKRTIFSRISANGNAFFIIIFINVYHTIISLFFSFLHLELEGEKINDEERVVNRVVRTQHSLLSKKFRETMMDYENALLTHKQICEGLIKKQLHIGKYGN